MHYIQRIRSSKKACAPLKIPWPFWFHLPKLPDEREWWAPRNMTCRSEVYVAFWNQEERIGDLDHHLCNFPRKERITVDEIDQMICLSEFAMGNLHWNQIYSHVPIFPFVLPISWEAAPTIFENELVIHKDKENFLVVSLLALNMKKNLSAISSWVSPTKKGMEVFGHCMGRVN